MGKLDLKQFAIRDEVEWYTPPDLVAEIAAFFGQIDLDPCADPGHHVPARLHESENGLGIPWRGKVFCNPPYGRQKLIHWIEKALSEPTDELILLVPGRVDTAWFRPLWNYTLCFCYRRLHFWNPSRVETYRTVFPSVLVYCGPRPEAFKQAFSHRGHVVMPAVIV